MLTRLMSKGEYLIVRKGTKFKGSGKLGLITLLLVKKKGKKSNWVTHGQSAQKYLKVYSYSSVYV